MRRVVVLNQPIQPNPTDPTNPLHPTHTQQTPTWSISTSSALSGSSALAAAMRTASVSATWERPHVQTTP